MGIMDSYKPPDGNSSKAVPTPTVSPPAAGGIMSTYRPPAAPTPSPAATSAPISPSAPGGAGQGPQGGASMFTHVAADQPASFTNPNDPGLPSVLNNTSNMSTSDLILAHLASLGKTAGQTGQFADDMVRAATNTFGAGDRFAAGMSGLTGVGGGDLAAQRADTAAANARLPPEARIAANMIGYGPLAAQGIATGLGGGIKGAVAEGATSGLLSAAGNRSPFDIGSDVRGTLGGAALGIPGGVGSKILNAGAGAIANKLGAAGPLANPAADITAALKANKEDKFGAFNDLPFAGNDIGQAAANARAEIEDTYPGGPAGSAMQQAAPRSMAVLGGIEKRLKAGAQGQTLSGQDAANWLIGQRGTMSPDDYSDAWTQLSKTGEIAQPGHLPTQSGADLLTSLDKLRDIQGPTAGAENDIAPIIEKHLNNMLATSAPANGLPIGAGASMLQDARAAQPLYKNALGLQKAASDLKNFGTSPAAWAQQTADRWHPDENSPQYQALSNIANAGGAPLGQSSYTLTHGVVHPIVEGLALATLPAAIAPAAAAGATFLGLKPMLSAAMGAGSKAGQMNALRANYPALTGRQFVPPPPSGPDLSPAARALLFGAYAAPRGF